MTLLDEFKNGSAENISPPIFHKKRTPLAPASESHMHLAPNLRDQKSTNAQRRRITLSTIKEGSVQKSTMPKPIAANRQKVVIMTVVKRKLITSETETRYKRSAFACSTTTAQAVTVILDDVVIGGRVTTTRTQPQPQLQHGRRRYKGIVSFFF